MTGGFAAIFVGPENCDIETGEADMVRANRRYQTGWRRLLGWCAAYLLVLHVGFAGAATAHFFAPVNDAGHVFCLNGTDGPSSPANAPAQETHGKIHCVLCSGGGAMALPSMQPPAAPRPRLAATFVPASEQAPSPNRRHAPNQSRAPPLEV